MTDRDRLLTNLEIDLESFVDCGMRPTDEWLRAKLASIRAAIRQGPEPGGACKSPSWKWIAAHLVEALALAHAELHEPGAAKRDGKDIEAILTTAIRVARETCSRPRRPPLPASPPCSISL